MNSHTIDAIVHALAKTSGHGSTQSRRTRRKPTPGQATFDAVNVVLGADASAHRLLHLLEEEEDSILGQFFVDGRRWRRLALDEELTAILALRGEEVGLHDLFEAHESIKTTCAHPEWHMASFLGATRFSKAAAKAFLAGVHDACGAVDQ